MFHQHWNRVLVFTKITSTCRMLLLLNGTTLEPPPDLFSLTSEVEIPPRFL